MEISASTFKLRANAQEDSKRFSLINRLGHSRWDAQDANPHEQTARRVGADRWMGHVSQYGAGRVRRMMKIAAVKGVRNELLTCLWLSLSDPGR